MARDDSFDVHGEIFRLLLQKLADERHPSGTILNLIEQQLLKTPDDVEMYVRVLMEKIESDRNFSVDLLKRVLRQAS